MTSFFVKLFDKQIQSDHDQDNGCIFILPERLIELKWKEGSWVKIWTPNDPQNYRYAKTGCIQFNSNLNSSFVYLSPLLWFNLRGQHEFAATALDHVSLNLMVSVLQTFETLFIYLFTFLG